jgi:hypothetical protein
VAARARANGDDVLHNFNSSPCCVKVSHEGQLLIIVGVDYTSEDSQEVCQLAHSRNYTLSETTEKQLRQRGLSLVCIRCGEPLQTGEAIVSKKSHGRSSSRFYHSKCYAKLYL